ncbi:hypothetical protein BLL42_28520 (plasmid) [Pseudomonas frederiksbergensis]|uniref:Uncharacterized protein n=2 Tax=Pseudomonas frederiksbergensis TaxID=104087 RepID=A0A1J0EUL0_9PSED|nr:hypothetical protein BLL42_28520 [Pseudomonas frederiksbergensis]
MVFSYRAVMYKDRSLGLYTIEVQERPIYAKKKYGIVDKDIVYVRYGSSTAIADPTQIAKMGAMEAMRGATGEPLLAVEITNIEGQTPLNSGISFAYTHLMLEEYPDYTDGTHGYLKLNNILVNRNYYRDLALYHQVQKGSFGFRLSLVNRGTATAHSVRVHLCLNQLELCVLKLNLRICPAPIRYRKLPTSLPC